MHEIRRNPHKSKLTNCFYDLVKSFMKMFQQSDQLDCHMTVYERSLFLVSTLFYQHVTESGKFKPWVLLRVTQTHEFWVMHVLIFGPLSMSNHTHTLTWIAPWIEYMTFVSVVMSACNRSVAQGVSTIYVGIGMKSGAAAMNQFRHSCEKFLLLMYHVLH